ERTERLGEERANRLMYASSLGDRRRHGRWPFVRSATPHLNGSGRPRAGEGNNFFEWERLGPARGRFHRDGPPHLRLRLRDGVDPNRALDHLRDRPTSYRLDCATSSTADEMLAGRDYLRRKYGANEGNRRASAAFRNLAFYSNHDSVTGRSA